MTSDYFSPGMFVTVSVPAQNIVIFLVKENDENRRFTTVDLNRMSLGHLSYFAVTKDMKEFSGDIDEAKKKTIRDIFT